MRASRAIQPIRLAVLLGFTTLGTIAPTGCAYVPAHDPPLTLEANDAREAVGGSGSGRPLLVGRASRRDVEDLLGTPTYRSDDGRAVGYAYRMHAGTWVGLGGHEAYKFYGLFLEFDRAGALRDYRLVRVPFDYDQPLAWQKFLRQRGEGASSSRPSR